MRYYGAHGIRVERVLTDNGACFKRRWAEACAAHGIAAKKTRAYRPQTNGKAERFIRTLQPPWDIHLVRPLKDELRHLGPGEEPEGHERRPVPGDTCIVPASVS